MVNNGLKTKKKTTKANFEAINLSTKNISYALLAFYSFLAFH